jgi:hypothetical protein
MTAIIPSAAQEAWGIRPSGRLAADLHVVNGVRVRRRVGVPALAIADVRGLAHGRTSITSLPLGTGSPHWTRGSKKLSLTPRPSDAVETRLAGGEEVVAVPVPLVGRVSGDDDGNPCLAVMLEL